MGKPYRRLKYDPPEKYAHDDMIEHGEAVSMITDVLAQDGERWDRRRQVDNHVRYAVKRGFLATTPAGHFEFGKIAAWANRRYGTENPDISRMHHGETVEVDGVAAAGEVGRAIGLGSPEDYKQELEASQQENEWLRVALAQSEARRERERPDAEIGKKVREGGRKGGNSPKEMRL